MGIGRGGDRVRVLVGTNLCTCKRNVVVVISFLEYNFIVDYRLWNIYLRHHLLLRHTHYMMYLSSKEISFEGQNYKCSSFIICVELIPS